MSEIPVLLYRTILLRPYVFVFLAVYLAAASYHLGWKRALIFVPLGYSLAWMSEFCSIHLGFPYGDYYYIPDTVGRELWVLGVPFMDSLSYVFLAYCSFSVAVFLLSPFACSRGRAFILETHATRRSWQTLFLGALLFVLLDIIIDPVALKGHRWFLGQIYGYKKVGIYFGIPLSNFGGWLLVGLIMVYALQRLDHLVVLEPEKPSMLRQVPWISMLGPILYIAILVFNLVVTFKIGEFLLGLVGCLAVIYPIILSLLFTIYKRTHLTQNLIERHIDEFPNSHAVDLLPFSLPNLTSGRQPGNIAPRDVQ